MLKILIYILFSALAGATASSSTNPDSRVCLSRQDNDATATKYSVKSACLTTEPSVFQVKCSSQYLLVERVAIGVSPHKSRCYWSGDTICYEPTSFPVPYLVPDYMCSEDSCSVLFDTISKPSNHCMGINGTRFLQIEYRCFSEQTKANRVISVCEDNNLRAANTILTTRGSAPRSQCQCAVFYNSGGNHNPRLNLKVLKSNLRNDQVVEVGEKYVMARSLLLNSSFTGINESRSYNSTSNSPVYISYNSSTGDEGESLILFSSDVDFDIHCKNTSLAYNNTECPEGWTRRIAEGVATCYLQTNRSILPFVDMRARCRACGADIADMKTQDEKVWVTNEYWKSGQEVLFWTGLHQPLLNESFVYTDGQPGPEPKAYLSLTWGSCTGIKLFGYGNFIIYRFPCVFVDSSPKPTTLCSAKAGSLTFNRLLAEKCSDNALPIVMKLPVIQPSKSSICPSGWWEGPSYTKSCYLFIHKQLFNWTDAETHCNSKGASLLAIRSKEELTWLRLIVDGFLIYNPILGQWWTGAHTSRLSPDHYEYDWMWTDNSKLRDDIDLWGASQPGSPYYNHCGSLMFGGNMNGEICVSEMPIICQRPHDWSDLTEPCKRNSNQEKLSGGAIAGITIGVVAVVGLLSCVLYRRRRKRYSDHPRHYTSLN